MGSTNKTKYLKLPQWIGTDKPTFLGDFNDAFLKIDTGYNTLNGTATTAGAEAGQAVEKATEALTKVNTITPTVNTANENATQALATANTALSTASSNTTKIESLQQSKANISDLDNWQTISTTTLVTASIISTVAVSYNPYIKCLNMFGRFGNGANNMTGTSLFKLNSIPFTIKSNRSIYGGFFRDDGTEVVPMIMLFSTNGTVGLNTSVSTNLGKEITFNCMLNVSSW